MHGWLARLQELWAAFESPLEALSRVPGEADRIWVRGTSAPKENHDSNNTPLPHAGS